ncbi:MAG: prephenate dehydratase [Candidatus Micrarchaeota archaeon]|nr:prephenate dehydratase [Candidatus Micrarchaeota archaeon]
MKVGTMGPEGTFSDAAAKMFLKGKQGAVRYFSSVPLVFEALGKGKIDAAVAPVENSLEGTVGTTVDSLFRHHFMIMDELVIDVHESLAVLPGAGKITRIISHPQPLAQCEAFLRKRFPAAELIPAASTVAAMMQVVGSNDKNAAVVGPEGAAKKLGLKVLARNIEDEEYNKTRFLVIGRKDDPRAKKAKTSIIIYNTADRPGLLYALLGEFAGRGINLTKIESRPSKKRLGEYIFIIDFEGSRRDRKVQAVLAGLKKLASVKLLGSYPKRY